MVNEGPDKVVQYIVVRKDLQEKFGIGFLGTQIAHASMAPITSQLRTNPEERLSNLLDNESLSWVKGPFYKIILSADKKSTLTDLMATLDQKRILYVPIYESLIGDELTSIGVRPYKKSDISKYFKGLPLLR